MNCFCGGEFLKTLINKNEYLLCKECGYLRKISNLSSKEEKERYDMHVCDTGYMKYMEGVYEKIKPSIQGVSLDFGCGQIHALSDIINRDSLCYYYDLYYYPKMPNILFDTIILIEVFEHIKDIYSLMLDLILKLNDNGRIIIMTQLKKYPLESWWYLRDSTHISFCDLKTMEALANKTGLLFIDHKDYFVFLKK